MSNSPSSSRTIKSPFRDIQTVGDASYLLKDAPHSRNACFIQKLTLKPAEQRRIPLGSFTEDLPPKGFLIEVNPDPKPANSVVTKVASIGSATEYSLFLDIANFGLKSFAAEIWQL